MNWLGVGATIAVLCCLVPGEAQANSCFAGLDVLLPSGGDVPPNTKIWIGDGHGTGELRLLDSAGDEVPSTRSIIERVDADYDVRVLTPVDLLPPGDYSVVQGTDPVTTFTVSGEPDTIPPDIPTLVGTDPSSTCTVLDTDATDGAGEVLLARVNTAGTLDPDTPAGAVNDIGSTGYFVIGECGCESTWLGGAPGEMFRIELAAFDVAGNFSGWSAPEEAELADDDTGCACRSGGSGTTLEALLLLVLAITSRRGAPRRSSRR